MQAVLSQNPLLEMGEYKFQDLCRELLGKETDVISCRDYEERGVEQFGADLIADANDGISTIIGQCKCYKKFTPAYFEDASDDFLNNLEMHWEPYDIKKFILFIACEAVKTNQQTAIQNERRRFHEKGIIYEVWDRKTIESKLRPHPQIVQTYFSDAPGYWLEKICKISGGAAAVQQPQASSGAILSISMAQAGKFAEIFTDKQLEELERIKEMHREGNYRGAAERLSKIHASSEEWSLLDSSTRAKTLKTLAANELSLTHDLENVKRIFQEVLIIDPEGDHTTFRATLEHHENGAEAALKIIDLPKTTDEINQKIGFYIELDNPSAALELIENPPEGIETNAETRRLHALALFEAEKIDEAWIRIAQVQEEKPLWEMVKISKAIIGYYSGLSLTAFPAHPLSWAMPVLWQLVKRDDESVLRFRESEQIFADLLSRDDKLDSQKMILESFRLACLANDASRQEEAFQYFKELLNSDPGHPFALAWAPVRGFNFDHVAARVSLEAKLKDSVNFQSNTQIEETVALLDIYLRIGETKKARELLEKTRPEFERVGGIGVFSFWRSRTAVIENKHEEALRLARSESDRSIGRKIQAMILRDRYFLEKSSKKAYKAFSAYLKKCWDKNRDMQCLIELCYLNSENGHWDFIADNHEQFIEAAGTADAVRLSAYALSFTRNPTKCLKILDSYIHRFPNSILPAELQALSVKCYTQQGVYSKALSEAERLHAREDSPESLLTLINAQLQKGDVGAIVYNAQKMLHLPDVEPKYILRVAKITALEDVELAKKLWRRVKDEILDDPELVRDALEIGFAIGLDAEIRDLMTRMELYARQGKSPFRTYSFKETLKQIKKGADRRSHVHKLYGEGNLPLHFLAGENSYTLATLLHELPNEGRAQEDFRFRSKIFTRFGGRSMREGYFEVKPEARLYMDITAFLLAAELGLLEKVEKVFAPIHVPSNLALALTTERRKLLNSHQPAEIMVYRRVLEKLEQSSFELFEDTEKINTEDAKTYKAELKKLRTEKVSLIIKAKNEGAYMVNHLPMTDLDMKPFTLTDPLADSVINCRVIAESLLNWGHLGQTEFELAVDKLGIDGQNVIEKKVSIPLNSVLYLDDYMVSALEKAELLDKVCEFYHVFADSGYIDRIKGEIKHFERDEKTAAWIQQLEKRLSDGFTSDKYTGVSVEEKKPFEKPDFVDNINIDLVSELLQLYPQTGACVWIDDRSVNSLSHAAGIPIVTITDILDTLRKNGDLSDEEYFDHLLALRSGNYRYIPLTTEEILHRLRQAKIIEGNLIETEALSILRRYTAACLLDEDNLQKPPMPKNAPNIFGELNFALEMTGTVSDAIIDVWNKEKDLGEARIRANWLFDNIFIGKYGVRHLLPSSEADTNGAHEIGVDFSEALAKAVVMFNNEPIDEDGRTRRQLYFEWLNNRMLLPRLKADPGVAATAVGTLKTLFDDHTLRKYESPELETVSRQLNSQLFLDLPESIANQLNVEDRILDWLGVSIDKYFLWGSHRFLSADFWTAAEKAVNGEMSEVSPPGSSIVFKVTCGAEQDGILTIKISDKQSGKEETMEHAALGVLYRDRKKRIETLKSNRFWFDCDSETLEREIEEIVSKVDHRGRIDRISELMHQSVAVYYKQLRANFEMQWDQGKKAYLTLSDLESFPPSGLLRHYRLKSEYDPKTNFSDIINDSAKLLVQEEGSLAAIERLSHLPFKLPECIVNDLNLLPDQEKIEKFDGLIATFKSPLGKMQLVDLLLRTSPGDEKYLEKAKHLVEEIYDEKQGVIEYGLFFSILWFVSEEFGYLSEAHSWTDSVKLAMIWAHAGKLFNILQPAFGEDAGFRRWLLNVHQHSSSIFSNDFEFLNDCLHPRKINRPIFFVHGAAALWAANERNDLESTGIFEKVRNAIAFRDKIPHLELLKSSELNNNSAHSIFGGDRAEILSALFKEGEWKTFSDTNIKENVIQALENLETDPSEETYWKSLYITVGNSPIYPDLEEKFKSLIADLDFQSILEINNNTATDVLIFIVAQNTILTDELRSNCERWMISLALKFAQTEAVPSKKIITEKMIDDGYKLLEIALTLSFRNRDPRSSSKKFKELMLELINIWKEFGAIVESAIATLNESLSLDRVQNLPEILLSIRASKSQKIMFGKKESSSEARVD